MFELCFPSFSDGVVCLISLLTRRSILEIQVEKNQTILQVVGTRDGIIITQSKSGLIYFHSLSSQLTTNLVHITSTHSVTFCKLECFAPSNDVEPLLLFPSIHSSNLELYSGCSPFSHLSFYEIEDRQGQAGDRYEDLVYQRKYGMVMTAKIWKQPETTRQFIIYGTEGGYAGVIDIKTKQQWRTQIDKETSKQ